MDNIVIPSRNPDQGESQDSRRVRYVMSMGNQPSTSHSTLDQPSVDPYHLDQSMSDGEEFLLNSSQEDDILVNRFQVS